INDVGRLAVEDFAKAAVPAQMQDEINHRKQARDNQKLAQVEKPANNAPHNKNNKKLPHVNAGVLDENFKFLAAKLEVKNQEQQAAVAQHNPLQYYRARVFNCPDYSQNQVAPSRTDFRKTVYWNPNILIDKTGKATISFYNNDEIASFKFIAEGIGANGSPAYVEKKIFTQLPFEMSLKMPENLIQDDEIFIPLVLKNNSPSIIKGNLKVQISEEMTLLQKLPEITEIPASNSITLYMKYKVGEANSNANISVAFNAGSVSDAFEQTFKIHAKGFPVNVSFSGKETNRAYVVDVTEMVKGSLVASATAYPSVVSDLMKGVESILREPGGCFEQTSMSSYPNILVKDYLQTIGKKDSELEAKANQLIERGYKKLIAFETKEKGYEWFGGAPGHEALTAYGLMQFNDMKKVYAGVDQAMIDRTANWLMASKDGKGGYKRNARALDNFGGADMQITNAYIT
ncbi:MAG: alpha-2-macroglobulin family protein, partial [Bacteroidota bacterium]